MPSLAVLKLHIKYYTKHNNGTQNVTGATYTWVSQVLCKNVDNHGDPGRKHQQLFKITKLQVNCNGLLWTSCYSARPPGIPFFNVQNSPVKQKIPEKYPCQQWIVFDMWCFMWQQNFTRLTTIKRSRVGNSICLSQTVRAYVAGGHKNFDPMRLRPLDRSVVDCKKWTLACVVTFKIRLDYDTNHDGAVPH